MRGISVHYTTNNSECINSIIKREVEWKENKLPVLVQHLKAIVDRQAAEVEKAIIGRGQWCFSSDYVNLVVPEAVWLTDSDKRNIC